MSEDYGKYIFELGENPVRTYSGDRMRPLVGFELGLEVAKVLADLVSGIDVSEGVKQKESSLEVLYKCLSKLDTSVYMGFLKRITSATLIMVKVAGDTKTYTLENETKLNDWFSKYPKDLFKFSVQIIWENASPFLPEEFQNLSIDMIKA